MYSVPPEPYPNQLLDVICAGVSDHSDISIGMKLPTMQLGLRVNGIESGIYMLYLSLRIVKEKQQLMTPARPLCEFGEFAVSGFLRRQLVNTAFCPLSNAIFPYFSQ